VRFRLGWVGPVIVGQSEWFRGAGKSLWEGGPSGCYSPLMIPCPGIRSPHCGLWSMVPGPCWISRLGEQSSAGGEVWSRFGAFICIVGILAKWFSATRLETRTKESNIYASLWVENSRA
jgi:hypothetical protein